LGATHFKAPDSASMDGELMSARRFPIGPALSWPLLTPGSLCRPYLEICSTLLPFRLSDVADKVFVALCVRSLCASSHWYYRARIEISLTFSSSTVSFSSAYTGHFDIPFPFVSDAFTKSCRIMKQLDEPGYASVRQLECIIDSINPTSDL
jgi:hypothetical protein